MKKYLLIGLLTASLSPTIQASHQQQSIIHFIQPYKKKLTHWLKAYKLHSRFIDDLQQIILAYTKSPFCKPKKVATIDALSYTSEEQSKYIVSINKRSLLIAYPNKDFIDITHLTNPHTQRLFFDSQELGKTINTLSQFSTTKDTLIFYCCESGKITICKRQQNKIQVDRRQPCIRYKGFKPIDISSDQNYIFYHTSELNNSEIIYYTKNKEGIYQQQCIKSDKITKKHKDSLTIDNFLFNNKAKILYIIESSIILPKLSSIQTSSTEALQISLPFPKLHLRIGSIDISSKYQKSCFFYENKTKTKIIGYRKDIMLLKVSKDNRKLFTCLCASTYSTENLYINVFDIDKNPTNPDLLWTKEDKFIEELIIRQPFSQSPYIFFEALPPSISLFTSTYKSLFQSSFFDKPTNNTSKKALFVYDIKNKELMKMPDLLQNEYYKTLKASRYHIPWDSNLISFIPSLGLLIGQHIFA